MRRLLGHLASCAILGVLLVTMAGSEAKGGPVELKVILTDVTTSTTSTFTILKGPPFDGSSPLDPNTIITNGTFETATKALGLQMSGITVSTNNPGTSSATQSLGGTLQVVSGVATSSDTFMVTIQGSQTFYTSPPGSSATLSDTESSSISNTTGAAGNLQSVKSWYDPGNAYFGTGAGTTSTPGFSYVLPAVSSPPLSLSGPPMGSPDSVGIAMYTTPYSLTSQLVIVLTGNGSSPNAKDVVTSITTLTAAVPEPASVVMFLTGMPLPLVVVGLLRRRRRAMA